MVEPAARLHTLRIADGDVDAPARRPLGALLLRDGLIGAEQLEEALVEKDRTGSRLGEILLSRGWVDPTMLARMLAEQHGLDFVDLDAEAVDRSVAALLPEQYARRYQALPVKFISGGLVLVAVADPTNVVASDDLRLALGLNVRLAVASAPAIASAIGSCYRSEFDIESYAGEDGADTAALEADDISAAGTSAPAIELVNKLVSQAIDDGASDLHIESQAHEAVVRARIDGVMRRVTTIPRNLQQAVTTRLKIMGELDIAERRAPQDGRVSIRHRGRPVDIRIAVLPTTHGEQVVLRIASRPEGQLALGDLGMAPAAQEAFARAIRQPYGTVLAVGPSGAGKTTTLYAALSMLNEDERVLMTIEDPVEYQMPGVNQIEANPRSGLTFAAGLRTILRSDPDVLLVGEIRDEETAQIAIRAAMTGHLVLSTLHAQTAAASIARLEDMGVEPSLLATSLNCIVAQRLARRLCPACREPYRPTEADIAELGLEDAAPDLEIYRARGCAQCSGTGYSGRVALYELLPVTGRLRRMLRSASADEIHAAAVEEGMTTLRRDGMRLVRDGISSLDEVRRVSGDWLD
jgi:type IV pilus assembly protein PilB